MLINRLIIKNFRSIKDLDIDLRKINALVGPNSAGKSNILKALNLIIGNTWPTTRAFDHGDFYCYDKSNPIIIEVRFSNPIQYYSLDVYGFRLTYDGRDSDYMAIGNDGQTLTYFPSKKEVRVNNQMRENVNMMYLPLDRQAYQQIKPSQWTVYGKLIKYISDQIESDKKEGFKSDLDKSYDDNLYPYIKEAEAKLNDFVKEQIGLELDLSLSIIDPTMILNGLRPFIKSLYSDLGVDIEEEGAGVQSAVAIAIARTYAEIVNQPLILTIEEPELYLHPHSCRHFYNILKDLSNHGVQIMYTTHERCFINIADFESIYLIKKENGETKVYFGRGNVYDVDSIRLASKFDEELNEVFFAEKVILVEGPDDKIACTMALEQLGVEINKRNISIIDCGGNTGIKPMAEILAKFNIVTIALVDEDPGNNYTKKIILDIKSLIGKENVLYQSPNLEGEFDRSEKFRKEIALKILPSWFSNNPVPEVYSDLKRLLFHNFP
jgi:putative ATP-dependent endonuclease of the OLD family